MKCEIAPEEKHKPIHYYNRNVTRRIQRADKLKMIRDKNINIIRNLLIQRKSQENHIELGRKDRKLTAKMR